jgi:hypothetical protein
MRRKAGEQQKLKLTPEEEAAQVHPGEMVIATDKRVLVRVQRNGDLIFGETYTPDEAAVALWTAVGRRRPDFEARLAYLNLLELHIALLAVSDAAYEAAQFMAKQPTATENERQREELSRRSLEVRVHGIIEFAREFANMRPDLVAQARRVIPGANTPPVPPPVPPPEPEREG